MVKIVSSSLYVHAYQWYNNYILCLNLACGDFTCTYIVSNICGVILDHTMAIYCCLDLIMLFFLLYCSDSDLITQCSCPENCTVLHLQFTHKNCLHAVATVVDTGALAGGNLEPMDTTASIASATSLMQGSGGGSNAMMGTPFTAAFQQTPLLPSLQPSGIMLPFD